MNNDQSKESIAGMLLGASIGDNMYTRIATIIERSDVASIISYRRTDGAYVVTFTDCESVYTFIGKYSGGETIGGKLYKFKKGGTMELIGNASMHVSVMNSVLSLWNNRGDL